MANVWQQFARIVTEMPNPYLARLRLARVRCNENIVRLESSLALQRSRREAIEAAIHDLEPELRLPPPKLKPNPISSIMRSRGWRWACCGMLASH
jgi:hypothetical protein